MSEPTSPALVVHYHEIGLKGRNRQYFEDALVRNLRRSLRGTGYTRVRRGYGRILVDLEANAPVEEAADRCSRVFGVAYVGAGRRVRADLSLIERLAVDMMAEEPFASFAVRARRTHARIEAKSQEINARIGRLIEETLGGPVDLTSPAVTLRIEIFGGTCIMYRRRHDGPGGLPAGVSGRMLALLSGGIDSPVAAWLLARRGGDVELVHFHGQPYTDPSSVRQVTDVCRVLVRYQLRTVLHLVPFGDVQREIVMGAPASLRVVLYRRMMLRIASGLAGVVDAQALVTGDSLGQVASQTLENITTVDAVLSGAEVFRPLIGLDKQEIVDLAKRIGTYEISTRKYQDCCVLFEPRSPATKVSAEVAARAEAMLDVEALVGKALGAAETRTFELEPPGRS
jgi:thiamine biosynthesis protein ThiI